MAKVLKIQHTKDGKSSHRYVLLCSGVWSGEDDLAVLDITRELELEMRQDKKWGHSVETGPCFGFAVWNAVKAGVAHVEVTERWRSAHAHDSVRPKIGYEGLWRIYKAEATSILREWSFDA